MSPSSDGKCPRQTPRTPLTPRRFRLGRRRYPAGSASRRMVPLTGGYPPTHQASDFKRLSQTAKVRLYAYFVPLLRLGQRRWPQVAIAPIRRHDGGAERVAGITRSSRARLMDAMLISPLLVGTLISVIQWAHRADAGASSQPPSRRRPPPSTSNPSDHAASSGSMARKWAAIQACVSAAEEHHEDQPDLVDILTTRVRAWAEQPGTAVDRAWSVYFWLGKLRSAVGQPLFFDPEAAVLACIADGGWRAH